MMTGRSGNRGECAQICRTAFDLTDARGRTLLHDKHLLSLRDMNRAMYLAEILKAGVISLKVEGRLKDETYVKNITGYYRQQLDAILESDNPFSRLGSGRTTLHFQPDPERSFNRGYTPYFIDGQRRKMATFDTPKARGKSIGHLRQDRDGRLFYEGDAKLVNGDGLCFINEVGELEGFFVNGISNGRVQPHKPVSAFRRVEVYRNLDKQFEKMLSEKSAERKIALDMQFAETEDGFALSFRDEDGCEACVERKMDKVPAQKPEVAERQLRTSLSKLGDTPFELRRLTIEMAPCFLQAAVVNQMRGEAVERLMETRMERFRRDNDHRVAFLERGRVVC